MRENVTTGNQPQHHTLYQGLQIQPGPETVGKGVATGWELAEFGWVLEKQTTIHNL